ncbi:hypothetical protein [Bacillus sp. 2205SS5-2]|uniref:hypothetical protein n=1 Tax=Bacillus sp. 2205SS5-2 TaxID=3109031 RepID=UPI0030042BB4
MSITYDSIGTPISITGHTFKWENGDQHSKMTTPDHSLSFKYNEDGYRTGKVVGGAKSTFQLDEDKVIFETNGTDEIHYTYSSSGSPISRIRTVKNTSIFGTFIRILLV